jgi:hypothetical protein
MYKCNQCDKTYDTQQQLGGHVTAMIKKGDHIKLQKQNIVDESWKVNNNKYCCPYCNAEFSKKGIATHIWRIHTDIGREHKTKLFGKTRIIWNKGLTKKTSQSIVKASVTYGKNLLSGKIKPSFLGKKHSLASKQKIAASGGYRKGSGRGKSGWYNEYWCDSTWELAWVIYNLEHNIKFSRNKIGFEYEYKNKKYKFYPDFILEDGTYVEIKGYMDDKNAEKIKQFNHNIIIICKLEIIPYLNYATGKYGKNLKNLYHGNSETK